MERKSLLAPLTGSGPSLPVAVVATAAWAVLHVLVYVYASTSLTMEAFVALWTDPVVLGSTFLRASLLCTALLFVWLALEVLRVGTSRRPRRLLAALPHLAGLVVAGALVRYLLGVGYSIDVLLASGGG